MCVALLVGLRQEVEMDGQGRELIAQLPLFALLPEFPLPAPLPGGQLYLVVVTLLLFRHSLPATW